MSKLTAVVITRRGVYMAIGGKKKAKGREVELGTEMEMTERQLRGYAGKYTLASKMVKAASEPAMAKENAGLQAQVEALTAQNAELQAQVDGLLAKKIKK